MHRSSPLPRCACHAQQGHTFRSLHASLAQQELFPPSLEHFLQASAPFVHPALILNLHRAYVFPARLVMPATPLYLHCPLPARQACGPLMAAAHATPVPVAFSLCRTRQDASAVLQALSLSAQPAAARRVPQVHSPRRPTPQSAVPARLASIPTRMVPRPQQCVCHAQQAQRHRPPEQRQPSRARLVVQEDLQMLW